jgi:putative component of toxin-antitoxin plasmid stabilization module
MQSPFEPKKDDPTRLFEPLKTSLEPPNGFAQFFLPAKNSVEPFSAFDYLVHLTNIFDHFAKSERAKLPDFIHKIENLKLSIKDDISKPDYDGIIALMQGGSFDIRTKSRPLIIQPSLIALNQKETASILVKAINGDSQTRAEYESTRLIFPEKIPLWLQSIWHDPASSTWRNFSTEHAEFKNYTKKFGFIVDPRYTKTFFLPPLSKQTDQNDIRLALYFHSSMNRFLNYLDQESQRPAQNKKEATLAQVDNIMDSDYIDFLDWTIVGQSYRQALRKEYTQLLVAHIIDDALPLFGLQLSDEKKVELWKSCNHNPWAVASHKVFSDGPKVIEILRASDRSPEQVQIDFEKIIFNKNNFREFFRGTTGTTKAPKIVEPLPELTEVTGPQSFDPHRVRAKVQLAIEANVGKNKTTDGSARKISKLIGNSEVLLTIVISQLQDKINPDVILEGLLNQNKLDLEAPPISRPESTKSELSEEIKPKATSRMERLTVVFYKDAQDVLKDPEIKESVMNGIEKLINNPQSADKRRIWACQEIWELRLIGQALRVYFFFPGNNTLAILKIGHKKDQHKDVPKLNAIKNSLINDLI